MKSSLGQYGELYQRDEQGRISQITYLGADGNPAPTTAGYTVLKRTYHRDGTADIDMYFVMLIVTRWPYPKGSMALSAAER